MICRDTEQRSALGGSAARSKFLPFDMPLSYLTPFKNGIPIAYMIYSMMLVFVAYCSYMRPRCLDVGINIAQHSYTTAVPYFITEKMLFDHWKRS